MKKLMTGLITLCALNSSADILNTLSQRLNLSAEQSSNLRSGLSSMLSGSNQVGSASVQENLSLGECFEMFDIAAEAQGDDEFINIGYANHNFHSRVIDGQYSQFLEGNRYKFGQEIMRGLSNKDSISFNSISSGERAPHADSRCLNFMDIEMVSKVKLDGEICRKVDLVMNARVESTNETVSRSASNIFCKNTNKVKSTFKELDLEIVEVIKERE